MQVPSQKPGLAAIYLNLLQARPAPPAPTKQTEAEAPATAATSTGTPAGAGPPRRGSLIDIVA